MKRNCSRLGTSKFSVIFLHKYLYCDLMRKISLAPHLYSQKILKLTNLYLNLSVLLSWVKEKKTIDWISEWYIVRWCKARPLKPNIWPSNLIIVCLFSERTMKTQFGFGSQFINMSISTWFFLNEAKMLIISISAFDVDNVGRSEWSPLFVNRINLAGSLSRSEIQWTFFSSQRDEKNK